MSYPYPRADNALAELRAARANLEAQLELVKAEMRMNEAVGVPKAAHQAAAWEAASLAMATLRDLREKYRT